MDLWSPIRHTEFLAPGIAGMTAPFNPAMWLETAVRNDSAVYPSRRMGASLHSAEWLNYLGSKG